MALIDGVFNTVPKTGWPKISCIRGGILQLRNYTEGKSLISNP